MGTVWSTSFARRRIWLISSGGSSSKGEVVGGIMYGSMESSSESKSDSLSEVAASVDSASIASRSLKV